MPISGRGSGGGGGRTGSVSVGSRGTVSGFTALCLGESNIVTQLPSLRYPLHYGKVSYSESFEGNPTGSITYDQLTQDETYAVIRAYPDRARVNLYGVIMEVLGREYSQDIQKAEELRGVAIFTVKINLQCINHKPRQEDLDQAERIGYYSYATGTVRSLGGGNTVSNFQIQGLASDRNLTGMGGSAEGGSSIAIGGLSSETATVRSQPANGWGFSPKEIVEYSAKVQMPLDGCKGAEFSWEGKDEAATEEEKKPPASPQPKPKFIVKPPIYETTREGDEDPGSPPENTTVLRDLSSNFDESGDKKVVKETTSINGKPYTEKITTYGFVYLTSDIYDPDSKQLLGKEPSLFWRVIEERTTTHSYQSVGGYSINISFIEKNDPSPDPMIDMGFPPKKVPMRVIIHPDYEGQGNIKLGPLDVAITSNARYHVESSTRGWQLNRLIKETLSGDGESNVVELKQAIDEADADEDPKEIAYRKAKLQAMNFEKTPLEERQVYLLSSLNSAYRAYSKPQPPFQVEYVEYGPSMDPKIRAALSLENASDKELEAKKGKVAVITPDLNYVEPLYIKEERSYSNSFRWAIDPERLLDDEEEEEEQSEGDFQVIKPLKRQRLVTGQESWNSVARTIQKPDLWEDQTIKVKYYREHIKEYSSQDPGFDNSIERVSFRESTGDPPSANYTIEETEMKDTETDPIDPRPQPSRAQQRLIYLATTPDTSYLFTDPEDTGSAPSTGSAKSFSEAIQVMKLSLKKGMMSLITSEIKLSGFHPWIRCGQSLSCPNDRHVSHPAGTWIVTEHSWELTYKGFSEDLGVVMATHDGTSISRGLAANRPLSITTKLDDSEADPSNPAQSGDDPILNIDSIGGVGDIGSAMLPGQKTRRNF